jgi:hypothetical protein
VEPTSSWSIDLVCFVPPPPGASGAPSFRAVAPHSLRAVTGQARSLSPRVYNRWETGTDAPRLDTLGKIADILSVKELSTTLQK